MDGTLCKEVCWTVKDVLGATPNKKVIDWVNARYEEADIMIYTARRDFLISATLTWLHDNGVKFHTISNHKVPADIYLDDHALNIEDIQYEKI